MSSATGKRIKTRADGLMENDKLTIITDMLLVYNGSGCLVGFCWMATTTVRTEDRKLFPQESNTNVPGGVIKVVITLLISISPKKEKSANYLLISLSLLLHVSLSGSSLEV